MDLLVGNLLYVKFPLFALSLACLAFVSYLETAVTALRMFKIKELAQTKTKYLALLQVLEKKPHRVLITILIASSFCSTATAALITHVMKDLFAHLQFSGRVGFTVGVSVATIAILIFGEIIPKNFAKTHGEKLFKSTLWFTNLMYYILQPFVKSLVHLSSIITNKIGSRSKQPEAEVTEREIQFLISYIDKKGLIANDKSEMLQSVFALSQTIVKKIIVPAVDIVSISRTASLENALTVFGRTNFSRLPVYDGQCDNIIGMLYQKDIFLLLSRHEQREINDLIRPIMFIPETVRIDQLLRKFKEERMHMAIVINEFGGLTGLVTLENVLEEIVGDINDENELVAKKIIPLERGGWLIEGNTALADLRKRFGITFKTEAALTLAGFLTEQLQRVPKKGESILYQDYSFQIHSATQKRIQEVLVVKNKTLSSARSKQLEAP